jgi:hypothetical protein
MIPAGRKPMQARDPPIARSVEDIEFTESIDVIFLTSDLHFPP